MAFLICQEFIDMDQDFRIPCTKEIEQNLVDHSPLSICSRTHQPSSVVRLSLSPSQNNASVNGVDLRAEVVVLLRQLKRFRWDFVQVNCASHHGQLPRVGNG